MSSISFQDYKQAVAELPRLEQELTRLRRVIEQFEAEHQQDQSPHVSKKGPVTKIPYNLQAVYNILTRHGGPMRLRDIAAEHDLTTAGTRAQLLALIDLKLVEQVDRGIYRTLNSR